MPDPAPTMARVPASGAAPTFPLNEFYARARRPLPRMEIIAGDAVPEPYKALLVHNRDMTPTLEKFHSGRIHLEIVSREQRGDAYFREVVLRLDGSEKPVEFGANRLHLERFPAEARELILGERVPLGTILRNCVVHHATEARAFLRVESDELMSQAFGLRGPAVLYGRKAVICDTTGQLLSEIVEILPPAD